MSRHFNWVDGFGAAVILHWLTGALTTCLHFDSQQHTIYKLQLIQPAHYGNLRDCRAQQCHRVQPTRPALHPCAADLGTTPHFPRSSLLHTEYFSSSASNWSTAHPHEMAFIIIQKSWHLTLRRRDVRFQAFKRDFWLMCSPSKSAHLTCLALVSTGNFIILLSNGPFNYFEGLELGSFQEAMSFLMFNA
jgi:hypothetical protein